MRTSPVRPTIAALLTLAALGARPLAAQTAPGPIPPTPARSAADPRATRAAAAAFRDTVDGEIDRDTFYDGGPRPALARRITAGLSAAVSQPLGDFRQGGRVGFGVEGFASISADPAGVLGLRLEGGAVNYGNTTLRSVTPGVYSATQLRQTTSNNIFWLGVGPQLTIPLGPVRPYGFATIGTANFSTSTAVQYALYGDGYGTYPYGGGYDAYGNGYTYSHEFSSDDLSRWALTRAAGGGVRVRVGHAGRELAFVDAGVRWARVNEVAYLAPGAIPSAVDPSVLALRGRPNYATYHLGVSFTGR